MSQSYPRILYVDNDADSCEIVQMMLEQADESYKVTTLDSAEEAAGLINLRPFDLYIFDQPWHVPSGLELCRQVREKDGKTPILIFSVLSREADREKAAEAGANEYLVKADEIQKLVATVKRLLDVRSRGGIDV